MMMNGQIVQVLLALLVTVALVISDPQLIDNGYENVIVQIEDSVPENMCTSIFHGLEETFTRGSSVLYLATHRRTYFRQVTVVVPKFWTGSHCPSLLTSSPPSTSPPAISVGAPHPVFMHKPWTLQEKGCGQPGTRIFLTPEFLAARNHSSGLGDSGRLLVHEWAKYRWGVFEEYGHEGDPIYPPYQRSDAHTHVPTGCSNLQVKGAPESCNPDHKSCHFVPSLSQNDGVTSSLMYLHYLPRVTQFCDGQTHNPKAPTKQNVLCNRRSVWDVIRLHGDFTNSTSIAGEEKRDTKPTFEYVRPGPRRYVIVIEDTTIMNVQKRWDFLRKAVRKLLVYDLPVGQEIGVVLFDEKAEEKLPLATIPAALEQRQRLATASLPRNPSRVAPSQKCIACGLQKAIEILRKDSKLSEGSVIILISSGSPVPLSEDDIKSLENIVLEAKIQLVPIMYPVTKRNPKPTLGVDRLAQTTGTRSFAVLDVGIGSDSKVSMMVALMNSLYAALKLFMPSPRQLPIVIHQQEFPGGISSTSQGSFDVDKSMGGEIRFCLTYYDLGHVGNNINLIDPQGITQDSVTLQEEDGDVNMIFVTIRNPMAGKWSYRIENRADSHQSLFIQVLATPPSSNGSTSSFTQSSDPSLSSAITLEAWTSSRTTLINVSDTSSSVAIYAQIWADRSAVVGVKVLAVLQRLGFNSTGSSFKPIRFNLFDNGNGDADLTRNDGIYSRYLPVMADTPARYALSVEVTDDDGEAAIVAPSLPEQQHSWANHAEIYFSSRKRKRRALAFGMSGPNCCGSVINYSRTINAGHLSRSVDVGIIDVIGQETSVGVVPPSRVADFRVTVTEAALHATFVWTSPGNQRDHGRASRYEVVFSRDEEATMKGLGEKIDSWPTPQTGGHSSQHTIRWNRHDGVYFVALRAVGRSGGRYGPERFGSWSNVVSVYVPPPATTTEMNTRGSTLFAGGGGSTGETIGELSPPAHSRSRLTNKDILAIIGAACGILLIVLVLAIYYMIVVSRRSEKDKKVKEVMDQGTPVVAHEDDETDSISKQHPPPLENLATCDPPAHRPLSPIQSWPASKLLAEHERRRNSTLDQNNLGEPDMGLSQHMDVPDLGAPQQQYHQQQQFYYHTPNGHYIEDTIPIDSGSMVSTSESLLVYGAPEGLIHHPSVTPGTTPVSWEGGLAKRPKVPPPTLPKPSIPPQAVSPPPLDMSSERRRRNVTQV